MSMQPSGGTREAPIGGMMPTALHRLAGVSGDRLLTGHGALLEIFSLSKNPFFFWLVVIGACLGYGGARSPWAERYHRLGRLQEAHHLAAASPQHPTRHPRPTAWWSIITPKIAPDPQVYICLNRRGQGAVLQAGFSIICHQLPIKYSLPGFNVKNIARPVEVFAAHWEDRWGEKETRDDSEYGDERALPHWPPDTDRNRAPYRGLKPFESVDAAILFGRDAPIAEATDRLRDLSQSSDKRLLVILAASGAGKSSFLRAGLLPRLARDARRYLTLPVIRPERSALYGENGLLGALEASLPARSRAELRATIRSGAEAVRALLGEIVGDRSAPSAMGDNSRKRPTVVMAIDQAEELFRANAADEGSALLTLVRELTSGNDPQFIAIFTIRSDLL